MIKFENHCVDCSSEGQPCLGNRCPKINEMHIYCDACRFEVDELYQYDEEQLCEECLLKRFKKIEV